MKKHPYYLILILLTACTTRDSGCGGAPNSDGAEEAVKRRYGTDVTCIADDESTYTCSDDTEQKLYRCADSAAAKGKIKCIPWFPTE